MASSDLTVLVFPSCQSATSPIYSFSTYYYTMPIKRSYFPIFIFVTLGKVAAGIFGTDGEIRRLPAVIDNAVV